MAKKDSSNKNESNKIGKRKTNDWIGFGEKLFKAFIFILIIALFGCNTFYLADLKERLDPVGLNLMPDNEDKAPYCCPKVNPTSQYGGNAMKKNIVPFNGTLNEVRMVNKIIDGLGFNTYSMPYSINKDNNYMYLKWLSNTLKFVFSTGRKPLNAFLKFFDTKAQDSIPLTIFNLLILPIFGIIAISFVTPFYGLFSTIIGSFVKAEGAEYIFSIVFLLFGLSFTMGGIIGVIQLVLVVLTFGVLPILLNGSAVLETMSNNYGLYSGLFGLAAIFYSFKFLKSEASVVMLITYIYLLWKTCKKQPCINIKHATSQ